MSSTNFLISKLVPDELVFRDLRSVLTAKEWKLDLKGKFKKIAKSIVFEIVERWYFEETSYEFLGIGTHYRIVIALGGVNSAKHGVIRAPCGFARMFYTKSMEMIRCEFHEELP